MKPRWSSMQTTFLLSIIYIPQLFLAKSSSIENVANKKEWEKMLRTRTNVLVLFKKSPKDAPSSLLQTLEKVADQMKGTALVAQVDCSTAEGKKVCKKEKADTAPAYVIKHYIKGEKNKDYSRPEAVKSFINFLKDPTADDPWDEDPTSKDVLHIEDSTQLRKFIMEAKQPALIMFYAPWCGHCKNMKPEYSAAASELKKEALLAAMDVNKPQNQDMRAQFNISGFPTLYYFRDGKFLFPYGGERTKSGIIAWMRDPKAPAPEPVEETWEEDPTAQDVVHLEDGAQLTKFLAEEKKPVLIMFYAPWCGHCKRMKPEYSAAATELKKEFVLAAMDVNKPHNKDVSETYKISGFPTLYYFRDGIFQFPFTGQRTKNGIMAWMRNPTAPAAGEDTKEEL